MNSEKKTNHNDMAEKTRSQFSGHIGYVLAVAGSAVGLGNIWRFPYLAAKYGGGIFLLVYLILTVTFGYVLIVSETALGRMTKKSPVGAFSTFGDGFLFRFGGWVNAVIPMLIVPYYSVIGGWVIKYLIAYLRGGATQLADDNYFSNFISSSKDVELYFVIFAIFIFAVIVLGVKAGVEKISKIMMPILVILAIFISVYSISRPGALSGVKYFLIPDFSHFSFMTIVAAMGQMFYSLSIAMGILYTYGSYIDRGVDIEKTTTQIEVFDTLIAVLSGLMIIPAVFAFSGGDPSILKSGPSLMFITMPKVFAHMGFGSIIGTAFFLLVFLAAATSAISLAETSVSTIEDELHLSRVQSTLFILCTSLLLGSLSAMGYGVLDFIKILGMQFLDFFDFLTNSMMMPLAAMATCWLIIGRVGFKRIENEVKESSAFKRQKLYNIFLKWFAPLFLVIILLSSIASVFGLISF